MKLIVLMCFVISFQAFGAAEPTAKPSTQPTTRDSEIGDLRSIIAILQKQIVLLKKENESLKTQLAGMVPAKTVVQPPITFTSRTRDYIKKSRITKSLGDKLLNIATETDKKITDYLATNDPPSDKIIKAMFGGDVLVGMTEEQIKLYGVVQREAESAGEQSILYVPWCPEPVLADQMYYRLTLTNGTVSNVVRPSRRAVIDDQSNN